MVTSLTNLTLSKRIGLLVLVGLVVGLGLFSWLGVQSLRESTDRILEERLAVARLMASHLDETLAYVLLQLQDVDFSAGLPTQERFAPLANSLRRALAKSGIAVTNLVLINKERKVLQLEPEVPGIIGLDAARYPDVVATLETGRSTISGLLSTPFVEVPVVLATVPVLNREGKTVGALTGVIDIEQSTNDALKSAMTVGQTGYTEIVDGNGVVLVRTSPGSFPVAFERSDHPGRFAELINQRQATVGTCHRCHETGKEFERRRDILAFAPLSTASWGVVIRQSEEEALAPTRELEQRLLLLGLIVLVGTFLLAWLVVQGIVRPLRMLTAAAKRVAAGDFKTAIPTRRRDEIGQLGAAFYTMTRELARSRDELVSRNEELAALNAIAASVGQSLDLKDVLKNALQKVLEVTRTSAGCVFLSDSSNHKLKMMSCFGLAHIFNCPQSGISRNNCACYQVLHHGQTLMVNDVSQCPVLGEDVMMESIGGFVSVPLKSKDRTLGIMNIAGTDEHSFTESDFRILNAIGSYIGLAVENSILYEEAKQKEQLRGQLLSRVINAQEEERKRIARELHDEWGQTLTGLMMSIESLEGMVSAQRSPFREKLKNAKSLIVRVLGDVRRLTLDLRPSLLDDLGLVAAIRAYLRTHLEDKGIQVDFENKGLKGHLAPVVETALFRIIQEAVHNITKHAEAHQVKIHIEARADKITATVEDDGKGFDLESVFSSKIGTQSLGLLGIQERVALLGGTFSIKSKAGQGTKLMVTIPLTRALSKPDIVDIK